MILSGLDIINAYMKLLNEVLKVKVIPVIKGGEAGLTVIYQEGSPYELSKDHDLVEIFRKYIPEDKKILASPADNDARLMQNIGNTLLSIKLIH